MAPLMKTKDHRAATDEEVEFLQFFAENFVAAIQSDDEKPNTIFQLEVALMNTKNSMPKKLQSLFGA